ncbi:TetR/AcrR family transcriptional regulator [Cellulosimicrobium arenosum]|uniref:TetR family transcriptional regulator n=1 Tax=Cellulosimicrobium arenosum TaxID=2708133 RepID=A0A927PEZ7_9MICO|nr:TetR family transcriptional regulator [Cellulosimicrobium arenosum]MBD8080103.1 TetR family transcriptional regulator [Cellulosimicrobium arenosum]
MTTSTPKSERTRAHVREVAVQMLRDVGYERTTMRAIATEAGVSTGNAYYHFPSKDALVQELYLEVQHEHAERAAPVLEASGSLDERLRGVWHAAIDAFAPFHAFGAEFVSVAIRPGSPASPFSADSAASRELSQGLFEQVVAGSSPQVPARLRAELPGLLWLAQLGVTLFWVYDSSPGSVRTRRLVDGGASLVGQVVRLSRLPVARGVVDQVLRLVRSVAPDPDPGPGPEPSGPVDQPARAADGARGAA